MVTIEIKTSKADVYKEVQITSEYLGAKAADAGMYERLRITDAAAEEKLERFWTESGDALTGIVKAFLVERGDEWSEPSGNSSGTSATNDAESQEVVGYYAKLELPGTYKDEVTGSMNGLVSGYFVQAVLAKWIALVDADAAGMYATGANDALEKVLEMLYHRKDPVREPVR